MDDILGRRSVGGADRFFAESPELPHEVNLLAHQSHARLFLDEEFRGLLTASAVRIGDWVAHRFVSRRRGPMRHETAGFADTEPPRCPSHSSARRRRGPGRAPVSELLDADTAA
jgi:hypothetical protein